MDSETSSVQASGGGAQSVLFWKRVRPGFPQLFVVLFLVFWVINYALMPNNRFISVPVHHDDYSALSLPLNSRLLFADRPVSTIVAALLSKTGIVGMYTSVNILAVLYAVLVICFVSELLNVTLPLAFIAVYGVVAFCSPSAFENAKYLGLLSNLTSSVLGTLCMIFMLRAFRAASIRYAPAAFLLYLLAVFAKEDFIVPPLLLSLYCLVEAMRKGTKRQLRVAELVILLIGAILLFRVVVGVFSPSTFTSGLILDSHHPYYIDLSLHSILKLTVHYLFGTSYRLMVFSVVVLATFCLLLLGDSHRRLQALLLSVVLLSLIGPYTLLPNHVFQYYVYSWLTWESALLSSYLYILVGHLFSTTSRKVAGGLVVLLSCAAVVNLTDRGRRIPIDWYAGRVEYNEKVLETLEHFKPEFKSEQQVGVVGVHGLSPWSHSDGRFLLKYLGLPIQWIVFIPENNVFFSTEQNTSYSSNEPIVVRNIAEACSHYPNLPYLYFDQKGNGAYKRACPAL